MSYKVIIKKSSSESGSSIKNKLESLPDGQKLSSSAIDGTIQVAIKEFDQQGQELTTTGELQIVRYDDGREIIVIVTSTGNKIPLS